MTLPAEIPLVDLGLQHAEIAATVAAGFDRVIERATFTGAAETAAFERHLASFCATRACVAVGSGGDALELLLRALQIGTGAEVLLPANASAASAQAVMRAGAMPVLVDVDPVHLLADAARTAAGLGPRSRALLVVHHGGQMAPMDELAELAASAGMALLEDASDAPGARQRGSLAGSLGLAAIFSLDPDSGLGAYGDAGAAVSDDAELARRVRALRDHGSEAQHQDCGPGTSCSLDTLQAVVLDAKLARLDSWNSARREAAERYHALLAGSSGLMLPATRPGNEHTWHRYVVRVRRRTEVLARLRGAGIGAQVDHPSPLHLQRRFAALGHGRGAFPVAEAAAVEALSLPLFPGITAAQQERVAVTLRTVLAAAA